jgi:hypothetical protein
MMIFRHQSTYTNKGGFTEFINFLSVSDFCFNDDRIKHRKIPESEWQVFKTPVQLNHQIKKTSIE